MPIMLNMTSVMNFTGFANTPVLSCPILNVFKSIANPPKAEGNNLECAIIPNPIINGNEFEIHTQQELTKELTLNINDMKGKLVSYQIIDQNDKSLKVSMKNIAKGLYLIRLSDKEDKQCSMKLQVE